MIHMASPRTHARSATLGAPARAMRSMAVVAASGLVLAGVVLPPQRAFASGDPVIAAAGDIACDPAASNFNGGNGTSSQCHEKYTGAQLAAGGFAAVLPLGD